MQTGGGELRTLLGQRIAHMRAEGCLGIIDPLGSAVVQAGERLLESETRPDKVQPVSLGGDLVEEARELTQAVLPP